MDRDFDHEIRQEDIALFDTLNPSDVLVMMTVGSHAKDMNLAFKARVGPVNSPGGTTKDLYNFGFCPIDIIRQGAAALGGGVQISEEEIKWSALSRGGKIDGVGKLFQVPLYAEAGNIRSLTNTSMCEHPNGMRLDQIEGAMRITLLAQTARLARILKD